MKIEDKHSIIKDGKEKEEYWNITAAITELFKDGQLTAAVEEMSELQKEICKWQQNRGDFDALASEIADVLNVLDSLILLLDCSESVRKWRTYKIKRTKNRLKDGYYNIVSGNKVHKVDCD